MDIHNPHDKFFKEIFSDKKKAAEFIKITLPEEINKILNYKSIRNENTEFVDEEMREYHSDLLFSIKTTDKTTIKIYLLFEHKSFVDKNINLQLLSYLIRIYQKMKKITPVIPIVFYHGKDKWNIPLKFLDSFKLSDKDKKLFSKYIPDFTSELIDLKKTDIEKMISSLTLRVILYTFKNIWYFEDIKKLEEFISLSRDLFYEESGIKIIQRLLLYLYSINDIEIEKVKDMISKYVLDNKGDDIMTTTAERLINQGIEKGIEKGILDGKLDDAKKMLQEGLEINLIQKITGLSIEKISKIKL